MIIRWNGDSIGHIGFDAETDDYDGEPSFKSYWFDSQPRSRHPDRQAIAAFLVFGSYMGGMVQVPHKFSPAVDTAMRALMAPVPVVFTPVEYYPKALPLGTRVLDLSWSGTDPERSNLSGEDLTYLRIERSDQVAGSLRTVRGMTLASNAWLHVRGPEGSLSRLHPYIAAAVLFAEDLDADTIRLPGIYDQSSREWKDLVYLLGTARLGLECQPSVLN